ncbi:GTP cyclohydrolase FolE2 [Agarilytica rhodophyticola]|uniref:GTP cyclohydrolase FolE2 n=1 Tax=Agarilytica rhodophyticola TaxID=1737490 RepID=UPI00156DD577|nr:GTP cyclohydrolase FolE2 [Agarilytica rhodophyticola]
MRALPDVTSDSNAETPSMLQWVGMEDIAVPITISLQNGNLQTIAAKAKVYVSLEQPEVKGIHMSRLHNAINQLAERECNKHIIEKLLSEMINSQSNIGQAAKIELSFDALLKKPALLSKESGFQSYPVTIKAEKRDKDFSCEFELSIPYSSTCPCSASLARQLYADAVNSKFVDASIQKADLIDWIQSSAGSVATPHSQRSYAYIRLSLANNDWPSFSSLIFQLEEVIGTPVQTAVKRVDEQEFARLNAENLMFCEDAARRIKLALEKMKSVDNYWFKVEHQESLHAHNAVVIDQKHSGSY